MLGVLVPFVPANLDTTRSLFCSLAIDDWVFLNKDGDGLLYLKLWCDVKLLFPSLSGTLSVDLTSLFLGESLLFSKEILSLLFGKGHGETVLSLDLSKGDLTVEIVFVFTTFGQGDLDLLRDFGSVSLSNLISGF